MKKVKQVLKLNFAKPVDAEVTPGGGEYGAYRSHGSHKGVDYRAWWRSKVYASERGTVVYSKEIVGSEEKTNYGKVVVIDHALGAGDDERHIYIRCMRILRVRP